MEKEIIIGKYTLESLTNGMYSNPLDLYREYIQNAVDSIDSAQEDMDDINCEYEINVEVDDWARVISIKYFVFEDIVQQMFSLKSIHQILLLFLGVFGLNILNQHQLYQ